MSILLLVIGLLLAPNAIAGSIPRGPIMGKVPPRPLAAPRAGQQIEGLGGNLVYHGGPVVHRSTSYAVFLTGSGSAFPPPFESGIARYLEAVAASSGSHDNVYSVTGEYADSSAVAAYENRFGGVLHDASGVPGDGCTSPFGGPCVSGGQIVAQLDSFIAANGLPRGLNTMYLTFLPPGYNTCDSTPACAYTDFCGYHSYFGWGKDVTLYAVLPWPTYAPQGIELCSRPVGPNGSPALDTEASVISHEQIETFTDPLISGWYDSRGPDGGEIGDKCVGNYGTPLGSTPYGVYNQRFGSDDYALQLEWSNAAGGCVGHSDAVAPPPPANDLFANAQALSGMTATRTADPTFEATKETGEPDHAGNEGGGSIWYRWTAPKLGLASVDTAGSNFDTLLGVYTGAAVSQLTEVASNDDDRNRVQSAISFFAHPGTTYWMAVDGFNAFGESTGGSADLNLSEQPAPNTRIVGRRRFATRHGRRRAHARFRLLSDPPTRRFECALDRHRFRSCRNHLFLTVAPGHHVLRARAIGVAGLRDPAPARIAFFVRRR